MNPICHHQLSTVINSRPVSSIYTPDFLPRLDRVKNFNSLQTHHHSLGKFWQIA